jgi:ABC-type transport system substrate-binding protein
MAKKLILTIVALLGIMAMVLPGCTGGGGELPSEYIGSGQLDGEGIPVDFFTDLDVRVGFCYAFDYDTYLEDGLQGNGIQRGAPVTSGLIGFAPGTSMYTHDLTLAQEHLEDAWDGEVWDKGFKFTLLYNAGNIDRKTACEILAENLADINSKFQVSILPLAWPTILGKIFGTRDMPMFQIGWMPDYAHADNYITTFMATYGTFSYFQGYGNSALDAQIQAAFEDTNPTTQQEKYDALQELYYTDAPGICLFQALPRRYFTQHITGFVYNPAESCYFGDPYILTKSDNGDDIDYNNDGIFIQQTIGDAESLDPAWMYDNASLEQARYVYETLIYYDGNSTDTFVPVLATDTGTWNAANHTLSFTIQEGIKFGETGNNLTPEDVEYSFERAMCQDRPGGPIWMIFSALLGVSSYDDTTFAAIDEAVEVDGQDVVFTLNGGDHWYTTKVFQQILCGGWASIVEKDWCITQGDWDGTEGDVSRVLHPENPGDTALFDVMNGTGGWKLNEWQQGIQITYDTNPYYHGDPVPFDHIYYQIVEEWSDRKLALMAGDADIVYVPASRYDEMEEEVGLNVFQNLPSLNIDAFFFNMIIGGPQS